MFVAGKKTDGRTIVALAEQQEACDAVHVQTRAMRPPRDNQPKPASGVSGVSLSHLDAGHQPRVH